MTLWMSGPTTGTRLINAAAAATRRIALAPKAKRNMLKMFTGCEMVFGKTSRKRAQVVSRKPMPVKNMKLSCCPTVYACRRTAYTTFLYPV
jgi:hypothetical protein